MTEDEMDELNERRHREEVWAGICAAFESRVRPAVPITFGDRPTAEDVENVLAGKDWQAVTSSDLLRIRLDVNSLKPEAFWYYFRAFAYHALLVEECSADDPGGWMVAALTPLEGNNSSRFRERIEALSARERASVGRFVRWYDGETYIANRDRVLEFWLP
ncbi:hypothetical protein GCM10017744_012710 [Streptomyces antimycoticus]|uniref:Uncharacterized protein n=1 Tax=Streptomyces antimycoticus TaxID=68175 RepID=A0A4D4KMR7_9ACTN|nr:hypothetical protein [Streptomyces antimycoticus]GDY47930.1 hypothetical protein SANT12839_088120 [Streptomyces antimycoticus]